MIGSALISAVPSALASLTSDVCTHCGLPLPRPEPVPAFCCAGCRSVYAILQQSGLGGYYSQRDAAREPAQPARISRQAFAEFDDPAFRQQHCRTLASGALGCELVLEGIHCGACVWLVERVGRVANGVIAARCDLSRCVLELSWDPKETELSAIARALDSLGYRPHAASATQQSAEARKTDRALLLRLGVAGAVAGNVMLMALALYSGAASGMSREFSQLFRWASFALATPTLFFCGSVFFRGALASLRTRRPHMDLPISIGIAAGFIGGAVNTLRGSGEVYFDSLCTLIFLLLVGRVLQQGHHRRSSRQSELLESLSPQTARVVEGENVREVPLPAVAAGAVVEVRAGERVPVDGTVLSGNAALDVALLTGESLPQEVSVGDAVYAGTINRSGTLRVLTHSAGAETRLGQLLEAVARTQRERAPIVRLADRVSGRFVSAILLLAALTLALWLLLDPAHAVDHTIALLVVTCPCALGMATPLAMSVALRRAARAGILFRSGESVEELARPGLVILDKTGTLTDGQLELCYFVGDAGVKRLARAVEARSQHPIARALQRAFQNEPELDCSEFCELAGGGVEARVAGHTVMVGSHGLIERSGCVVPNWVRAAMQKQAELERTPVLFAVDGVVCALAALADNLRGDTLTSLQRLRKLGYRLAILSGDHPRAVSSIARQLGIPFEYVRGGVSPEQKLATVRVERAAGTHVTMVGDGVNDAGAMAAANVGIAMHGGAEACLSSADVFMTQPGLSRVVEAAAGARKTLRTIRLGMGVSLLYNCIGVALALSGRLDPLLAAILMPLSSVSVVTLALRSRTFEPRP